MNAAIRRFLEAFSTTSEPPNREVQELRLRLAEMTSALDRIQAAAAQAQAEAEHYRDRAGAADQDLAEANAEIARLRQELECRGEVPQ